MALAAHPGPALRQRSGSKRVLRLLHRGLASALSVLLFVWFASGVIMTFHGYPEWGEAHRLASLPALQPPTSVPSLAQTLAFSNGGVDQARFARWGAVDVWILQGQGETWAVNAHTGARIHEPPSGWISRGVKEAVGPAFEIHSEELLQTPDQWTLASSLRGLFPLVKVTLALPRGEQLYLSTRTGQVVQRTNASSRAWAWVGAIPHWIYPAQLVRMRGVWRQLVMWLAGLGALACASGLALGLWNWRLRPRYREGTALASASPYRNPWLRWHHILGLVWGTFALTFLFSGLLSLHPFAWSRRPEPPTDRLLGLQGAVPWVNVRLLPGEAVALCSQDIVVKELAVIAVAKRPYYLCKERVGRVRLLAADDKAARPRPHFNPADLLPQQKPPGLVAQTLWAPDNYHRPTHFAPAMAFPVLRLQWPDAARTWVYVDLSTAKIVRSLSRRARWERWLYNGLHSFDLPWLYARPLLWQLVIVLVCAGGMALSLTGVVLCVRWCGRSVRRARLTPKGPRLPSSNPNTGNALLPTGSALPCDVERVL